MAGRPRTRLADRWHHQMLALLHATGRPWPVDELVAVVCGTDLTPLEREAARMAVDRLHATRGVAAGGRPPDRNGEAA
jgi:hypothetical protein